MNTLQAMAMAGMLFAALEAGADWQTAPMEEAPVDRIEAQIREQIDQPKAFSGSADEVVCLVWAFCSPHSRFRKDKRLEKQLHLNLKRLHKSLLPWREHEYGGVSRMSFAKVAYQACIMARQNKMLFREDPSAVLDEIEKSVLAAARYFADWDVSQPDAYADLDAKIHIQPWRATRIMTCLLVGYRLTGESLFLTRIRAWLPILEGDLQALGGLAYVTGKPYSNVQWYTDMSLVELAQFYLWSKDDGALADIHAKMKTIVLASKANIIHRTLPAGTADYGSTIWLKNVWHMAPMPAGAGCVALWTGDGTCAALMRYLLYYYCQLSTQLSHLHVLHLDIAAQVKALPLAPIPQHFLVRDESVSGVRGLDTDYGFVLHRGRHFYTPVSARISGEPRDPTGRLSRVYGHRGTYAGILQGVTPEIGLSRWKYKPRQKGHPRGARTLYVSGAEPSPGDQALGADWAALGVSYHPVLSKWRDGLTGDPGWMMRQAWLAMPKRLVGVVSITALAPRKAIYVANRIHFGAIDRIEGVDANLQPLVQPAGTVPEPPREEEETLEFALDEAASEADDKPAAPLYFRAGPFVVRIVAHNFPQIETVACEAYIVGDNAGISREIRMADGPTDGPMREYAAGTRYWAVIEVSHVDVYDPALVVEGVHQGPFLGVHVTDSNNVRHGVLYNHSNEETLAKAKDFRFSAQELALGDAAMASGVAATAAGCALGPQQVIAWQSGKKD